MILIICYQANKDQIDIFLKKLNKYNYMLQALELIELSGIQNYINQILNKLCVGKMTLSGVVSVSENGVSVATILATRLNLPSPSLKSILACQNKYISRLFQKKIAARHVPSFFLSSNIFEQKVLYPLFIKPVRASLSLLACKVNNFDELKSVISYTKKQVPKINVAYDQIAKIGCFKHKYFYTYNDIICEQFVTGQQITLDGYVQNGRTVFLGITESLFLPNGLSFKRFDYPCSLPKKIEQKIHNIVERLVKGINLDNTMFNIEFVITKNKQVFIIEINPRMSYQFVPLIKNVTGINPLEIMCDIAVGKTPRFSKKLGIYKFCSSCVLRKMNDQFIKRVPSKKELQAVLQKHTDVQITILVDVGKKLSDYRQDNKTFRYALVDIPGNSLQEIKDKLKEIKKDLKFKFELKDI